MKPKFKMGMVAGGRDNPPVAARLDGKVDLVAGAFSRNVVSIPREYTAIVEQWRRRKQSYQRASESTSSPSLPRSFALPSREELSKFRDWFNVVCDKR